MSHTPGPWRWELSLKNRVLQLCGGRPRFDKMVLSFERWGMNSATALFRTDIDMMSPAEGFAKIVPGREHHADWFQTVDHPDARLIASAPELLKSVERLLEIVDHRTTSVDPDPQDAAELMDARALVARVRGVE